MATKKAIKMMNPDVIEELAMQGLTHEQVGDYFGIPRTRVTEAFSACEDLRQAYDRGLAIGIAKATKTLMELVEKGNVVATLFYLKSRAGWIEKQHVKAAKSVDKELQGVRIFLPDNGRDSDLVEEGE
jgi:hypothetical protein